MRYMEICLSIVLRRLEAFCFTVLLFIENEFWEVFVVYLGFRKPNGVCVMQLRRSRKVTAQLCSVFRDLLFICGFMERYLW